MTATSMEPPDLGPAETVELRDVRGPSALGGGWLPIG